ncbi:MAG: alpha/beta hydrolase [Anaerolineales bacterium]|nr:alpha/beta hydrolase [Anaerolineales bacterium]
MKKIGQITLKIIGGIFLLLVLTISFFYIQSRLREIESRYEAAPTTGKFVQAGDVEIHILDMGPADGQVILFIHGTGAWSEFWRETMTPLAEAGYRCIAIDIPPFGYSEKPATPSFGNEAQAKRFIALMDALEIDSAILFGHSFGGGATLETALMIPERIDALILEDVGGLNLNLVPVEKTSPSVLEMFFETRAIRNPILSATATNPLLTKTLLSAMLKDPNDATDEKIKILQEPLVLEGATNTLGDWLGYVVNVQEVSLTSNPTNYQNLTMPTLIIWGDSDTVIPLAEGEYLASIITNAELVVMKDVNHVPHVEDLETLMPIVFEFLNK